MLGTFGNMFRIPELRKKILLTAMLLVICRVGAHLPVPGIDSEQVSRYAEQMGGGGVAGKALSMVDMLSGGALSRGTLFALGVMPFISASIIFQLLTTVVKRLEELAKEGEAGRKKINQYQRYAAVGICIVQGFFWGRVLLQRGLVIEGMSETAFALTAMLSFTAGSMFLMWIGEQITEYGIGNGISLIIMIGIVSRMPSAFRQFILNRFEPTFTPGAGNFGLLGMIGLIALYVAVVVGVIIIQQGQRRVTVQQAKHTRGRKVYGGQRHYMPLLVNQAGVIPIIFAQSLLIFPTSVLKWLSGAMGSAGIGGLLQGLSLQLEPGRFGYVVVYIAMIFFFCYFWTAVVFNPIKMADDMKQYGHFIPGIRPGPRTAAYLERLMTRVTLAGAAFLSLIAIFPQLVQTALNVPWQMALIFGGTGLLIVVGVALELIRQIESHLLMRHYDGFLKSGLRIRGRR